MLRNTGVDKARLFAAVMTVSQVCFMAIHQMAWTGRPGRLYGLYFNLSLELAAIFISASSQSMSDLHLSTPVILSSVTWHVMSLRAGAGLY